MENHIVIGSLEGMAKGPTVIAKATSLWRKAAGLWWEATGLLWEAAGPSIPLPLSLFLSLLSHTHTHISYNMSDFGLEFVVATAKSLGWHLMEPIKLQLRADHCKRDNAAGLRERREGAAGSCYCYR